MVPAFDQKRSNSTSIVLYNIVSLFLIFCNFHECEYFSISWKSKYIIELLPFETPQSQLADNISITPWFTYMYLVSIPFTPNAFRGFPFLPLPMPVNAFRGFRALYFLA
jgi:hypothetical protein